MKTSDPRIVCCTDFSENSRGAADVAAAIAARLNGKLVLVHAGEDSDRVDAHLKREVQRLRRVAGRIESVRLDEPPGRALGEYLAPGTATLAVVSSVSKTTFQRWTTGSVSEAVAEGSRVPTLMVRAPERLLAWIRQERALRAVIAVDFTASADTALAWVAVLKRLGRCDFTVAHVSWPPEEQRWLPDREPLPLTKAPAAVRQRISRELQKRIDAMLGGGANIRIDWNWGRPDAAIVSAATEAGADLVVVGSHQRQGWERLMHASISRGVLRHAPMSVACVPTQAATGVAAPVRRQVKRILVATDFSPAGNEAVSWALALLPSDGALKVLHVLKPEPAGRRGSAPATRPASRSVKDRRAQEAREQLGELVRAAGEKDGVEVSLEVIRDAEPARAIGATARTFAADLICLGSHGRSALGQVVIGSVARTVEAENPQPVVLVRPATP